MDTLTGIKVFRQVVESGAFVSAANRLDMSPAMVSKHVMQIEKRLGVRLLNRNSHTLSLTEPGRVYFDRCKTILEDLEATELELGSLGTAPRGTLRITAPSWAVGPRVAELLVEYRHRYPDVLVDASFEDRVVDLVAEGYDLALRVAQGPESLPAGMVARPVRPVTFYLAASRDYLKRNGTPISPGDLARHEFVAVGNLSNLTLSCPRGTMEVPMRVALRYRSMAGVANAIAAGMGIGPVPALLLEDPAFKDTLRPVLPRYPLWEGILYVIYVSRKHVPQKIRSFVDFIVESISTVQEPRPAVAA